ncbi:nuclear transport factor 2 family protein [Streptomyces lonarensis]|uniref:Nuclear transport factor 2 family protein n=1 Tax=Streptomyces lonarensis TaxID=700599 RepID=A0A7X6D0B0_9ACTN|nr:nuclear transport factor 2 family protein [Streptomyces lonarensis]NJQ05817.1 nuclear transport factor 2 family protein [Streptomyces lonarensis]
MNSPGDVRPARSARLTAVGVDHVRLSYHYLDAGDVEGYGSLLDENIEVAQPGSVHGNGRAEVLRSHGSPDRTPVRHRIHKIVADGDSVVALGRLVRGPGTRVELDFVDHFTISPEGMLLSCRRYFHTDPR